MENKRRSEESGFKPVLLIINKKTLEKLNKELESQVPSCVQFYTCSSILGLEVIVSDRIPDFQVIDNRPWTSQKF
jgi:hypothetical protein